MEKYQIQREIGCGNFAKVYLATNLHTNEEVALKLVKKKDLANEKAVSRIRAEMANMKKLSGHKNVVSLHETFETKSYFGIVMEYLQGGELFDFIRTQEGMDETSARKMFREIVEGVGHCHDNDIAHRDLKLENILLDEENRPKVADFGFSKEMSSTSLLMSSVGSLLYSSPEIVERKAYVGTECDVWSLGVILYVMLTATMPFDDSNPGEFLVKISTGSYPQPVGVSNSARDLLSRMINPDPFTRYTLSDILRHPWMSCADKNSNSSSNNNHCSSSKSRRNGVCYDNADSVRSTLLELNFCNCSCHKNGCDAKHGKNDDDCAATARDSVISRHCEDCDDFRANDPDVMHRRQLRLASRRNNSNSSVGSSGYGSEFGSQYLPTTPSPDAGNVPSGGDMGLLGFEMLMGGAETMFQQQRSTTPRKSSACSVATIKAKSSFQRCSVPARPSTMMREYASDDEEVVFV